MLVVPGNDCAVEVALQPADLGLQHRSVGELEHAEAVLGRTGDERAERGQHARRDDDVGAAAGAG